MGWLWTCPQILRPDWKGFPRTNTLAYWASSSATKEKSLITLTPDEVVEVAQDVDAQQSWAHFTSPFTVVIL